MSEVLAVCIYKRLILSEDLFFLMSFESGQEIIASTPVINPFYAYTLNATFVRIQRCSNACDIINVFDNTVLVH